MKYLLLIYCICLAACNPLKKIKERQDQLQNLVDAVNNTRTIASHDTTIILPGKTVTQTDTIAMPGKDSTRTITIRISSETHDTIKIVRENTARLEAATRELATLKGQAEGSKEVAANYIKLLYIFAAGVLISIIVICILKFR